MNANHARPLAAYSLLALVAAVITGFGVLSDRPDVQARHGSPVRVPSTTSPELVLGGVLRAHPGTTLTSPLSPDLWSPAALEPSPTGPVQVSVPGSSGHAGKARTKSDGHQSATVRVHATETAPAPTTTTTGHAKGRHKDDQPAKTTTTAIATAEPTAPDHGNGGGRPSDPGKGH